MVLLFLATCFLAYANGANDNFKGVASLFGSRTASYRTAIFWATITTFSGSVTAIFVAGTLLKKFSGRGLVPEQLAGNGRFLLAVALAGGLTVLLATVTGFPVSTTHALIGAMIGSGLAAVGAQVKFSALGKGFLLPLVLSPVLAMLLAAPLYLLSKLLRMRLGISKEWRVCVGERTVLIPIPQGPAFLAAAPPFPGLELTIGEMQSCQVRYSGRFLGLESQQAMDAAHFLSAGVVGFARGLNDTPKIAALLLLATWLDIRWGIVAVAVAMAIGGLLNSRKVAETMSHKITSMNHGQGLAANLSTGILVILASLYGLPVSTTHVSVGALFGIGLTTGNANPGVIRNILLSWVLTLPCAMLIGALVWMSTR